MPALHCELRHLPCAVKVELPSQFMENWCYNQDTLNSFARHYESNEPLPEDLYQKLVAARTYRLALRFAVAVACSMSFSLLALIWHAGASFTCTVEEFLLHLNTLLQQPGLLQTHSTL